MTTLYADNYEEITGQERDEDEQVHTADVKPAKTRNTTRKAVQN